MSNICDFSCDFQKWAISELFAISKRMANPAQMPSAALIEKISCGKNKFIWKYISKHVRSRASMSKIKNELHSYRINLKDKTTTLDLIEKRHKLQSQLTLLLNKIKFLENQIKEDEISLHSTSKVVEGSNQTTINELKFFGLLNLITYLFVYKEKNFCNLKRDISANLQTVDIRHNELSSSNSSESNVKNILNIIIATFNKVVRADSNNFHELKDIIWEKMENLLQEHLPSAILLILQEFSKNNTALIRESQNSIKDHSITNDDLFLKANCKTDSELKRQKVCNITRFFENIKVTTRINSLKEDINVLYDLIKTQIESSTLDSELQMKCMKLLLSEAKYYGSSLGIKEIQLLITDIVKDTKIILNKVDGELLKNHEIHYIQSLILSKQNAMCEFLKQNGKLIKNSLQRHSSQKTEILNYFNLKHGTAKLENEKMKHNLQIDKKIIKFIKNEFLKQTMNVEKKYLSLNINICDLFKTFDILPFQNEGSVIEICLQLFNKISLIKALLNDQRQTLHQLKELSKSKFSIKRNSDFCDKEIAVQMDIIKHASAILNKDDDLLNVQNSILEIQESLVDWWNQPAQYVYPITCENRTLNEWNSLLTMLLQS